MLRNIKEIEDFALRATDGVPGHIRNFYFDDESWVIRYFVVETGVWHSNRLTLLSPMTMGVPDWPAKVLPASITQDQVRNGPDIDTGKPNYQGGGGNRPTRRVRSYSKLELAEARRQNDPHLRSVNGVMRYHVHASDGDVGNVQGMLVEEGTWAIRCIIVNTGNWWVGHSILIAPEWIDDIYWAESKLMMALSRKSINDAPRYNPKTPVDRAQESSLREYYGQQGYWPVDSDLYEPTEHAERAHL